MDRCCRAPIVAAALVFSNEPALFPRTFSPHRPPASQKIPFETGHHRILPTKSRLLGRGSMHVFSCEQFQKLMASSGFKGPWHSLVDLGAGDGATTTHVAHLFEKVYATDISAPMRWALAKKKFTVLDVEKWYESGPFNVILCLNLLDRCDRPNTLLRRLKSSLAPGGRLVVALVLPFSPYVEVGERGDHKPSEYLPVKGNGLEGQIASLVDRVFAPLSLRCLVWSKLPYLCEGDLGQAYYFLDDVVFVLEAQSDNSRYSASEWMDTEPSGREFRNLLQQQTGYERKCNTDCMRCAMYNILCAKCG
ncbi:protein-L-histidine N-pros-methyltransferase isoform X4 [Frieseomelitta varia]|uniref:protein-L-histidine N-pros-methyltransferase isoform X4 n=1 Tax=Frieseomelitta varia TaxID=561572 RepID=UPI001CB69B0E|nr:protein-L-histidine N-pros-methyltransferase isoform X4 [Frieseomelitta varia]